MLHENIQNECKYLTEQINILQTKIDLKNNLLQFCKTPLNILLCYQELIKPQEMLGRKARKKKYKKIKVLENINKMFIEQKA